MKICAVQTRPFKGDIAKNIKSHKELITLAISNHAEVIIFPELSLTGYDPELAKALATEPEDSRFDDFQKISDTKKITIGVGMPIRKKEGIGIAMLIYQPHTTLQVYFKKYLHPDEKDFFVSGDNSTGLIGEKIALAICYEISVADHINHAINQKVKIYIASVAKSEIGAANAIKTLSDNAKKYSMPVLMANSVGQADNFECAGTTSIWNQKGLLLGQLDDVNEGILILDTETGEVCKKIISS